MYLPNSVLNRPEINCLHLRSSVKEIEKAVRSTGLVQSWWYLNDDGFEKLILKDIVSIHQVRAFVAILNADRYTMEGNKEYGCQKVGSLLAHLKAEQKGKEPFIWLKPSWFLASVRRIHCSCHEVGSFKPNERYYEAIERIKLNEKNKRKASIGNRIFKK